MQRRIVGVPLGDNPSGTSYWRVAYRGRSLWAILRGMSVIVRKSLGRQLKQARLAAKKSPGDVAASGEASTSKLHRVEGGEVTITVSTVVALSVLYGLDDDTRERLVEMAKHTNEKGWWEAYSNSMPSWFANYVELETAAARALMYNSELVVGMLQTAAYQQAQFVTHPLAQLDPEYVERQIGMRSERQRAAFNRVEAPPLELTAVLGEEALGRAAGGRKVMKEQHEHLRAMGRRPNVCVLVLPWKAGAHMATKGAFNILEFADPEQPSVVYQESYTGGRYEEEADLQTGLFHKMFDQVRAQSVPIEEFLK